MTAILYTKNRGALLRSALCTTGADWNLSVQRRLMQIGRLMHPQVATISSLDRLQTFVGGSTFTPPSDRAITVAQIRDLSQLGARTEAESLQFFSVTGKVSKTTLLEPDAVMATCKGCGDTVTNFFEDLYDCGNFLPFQ